MSNQENNNNLTSFSDHLDAQYGKVGTPEREKFEEGFEAFKLGVMLKFHPLPPASGGQPLTFCVALIQHFSSFHFF